MTEPLRIQHCLVDDVPALTALAASVWGPDALPIHFYRQAVEIFGESIFLARTSDNDRLAGYLVSLLRPYGRDGWIMSLGVRPDERRRGIGRALVQAAIAFYEARRAAGILAIIDPANGPSLALFRSAGFAEIERIPDFYAKGESMLRYRLPLDSRDRAAEPGETARP